MTIEEIEKEFDEKYPVMGVSDKKSDSVYRHDENPKDIKSFFLQKYTVLVNECLPEEKKVNIATGCMKQSEYLAIANSSGFNKALSQIKTNLNNAGIKVK